MYRFKLSTVAVLCLALSSTAFGSAVPSLSKLTAEGGNNEIRQFYGEYDRDWKKANIDAVQVFIKKICELEGYSTKKVEALDAFGKTSQRYGVTVKSSKQDSRFQNLQMVVQMGSMTIYNVKLTGTSDEKYLKKLGSIVAELDARQRGAWKDKEVTTKVTSKRDGKKLAITINYYGGDFRFAK